MEEVGINRSILSDEKLIDVWGRRNPRFEKKYELSVMRIISDYGNRAGEQTSIKAKLFGPGYETYIIAFFIGLYAEKKLPLSKDNDDLKTLGQPLDKWGNLQTNARKAYPAIRNYLLYALVAKTEIDWLAVDKGELPLADAVTELIHTMEEYANYGFAVMEEKLNEDKGYFFSKRAFLDIFLQLTTKKASQQKNDDDDLEEL
jgi:hypothetical protein